MSRREVAEKSGRPVPSYAPPDVGGYIADYFWAVRSFLTGPYDPITPALLASWSDDQGALLSRVERGIIYAMDLEYRKAKSHEDREAERVRAERDKKRKSMGRR